MAKQVLRVKPLQEVHFPKEPKKRKEEIGNTKDVDKIWEKAFFVSPRPTPHFIPKLLEFIRPSLEFCYQLYVHMFVWSQYARGRRSIGYRDTIQSE